MTPLLAEILSRSQRFHAEIARRAMLVPQREVRTFFIPNTPFGVPKIAPEPPRPLPVYSDNYAGMWFYHLVTAPPTPDKPAQIKIEKVQRLVAGEYGLSLTELLADCRTKDLVRPRQIAMFLCKKLTLRSLPEIGRRFAGRDHTTVLHAVRKIELLARDDECLAQHLHELTRKIMA